MSLEPGVTIGHYEILGALGSAAMGTVDKARETRLERTVAIKILSEAALGAGRRSAPSAGDPRDRPATSSPFSG